MDDGLEPRAWRLPVDIAIREITKWSDPEDICWSSFFAAVMKRWSELSAGEAFKVAPSDDSPYVHSLNVKDSLKDFIRFFLGISKMRLHKVLALEEILKQVILETRENYLRCKMKSVKA